ncbi:hypothetical protein F66182_7748 [Fusarium sp. NRRL 66182]|nr:hypothetical protein F66182_7748 [Fusarium sp. NRRL 66182]
MVKRGLEPEEDQDTGPIIKKLKKVDDERTPEPNKNGQKLTSESYTVGWICAISTEHVAAQVFLDERHEGPDYQSPSDDNIYTLGRVGRHNVVIAVLPDGEYGITSASRVGSDMRHTFPNIRIGLMVGIGGGAPSLKNDIRLGDIVVSAPRGGKGGIFHYDYGKTVQDQSFHSTGFLNQPPVLLRAAMNDLRAKYDVDGNSIEEGINRILNKKPRLKKKYKRPPPSTDRLHRATVTHSSSCEANCEETCGDDPKNLISRPDRTEDEVPTVHYGLVASSNRLVKDALLRDRLAAEKDVLCFEMEAAGLVNHFPCLVIRGICDYADSHKNNDWQGYAAMAAAAYTKDLLYRIPPSRIEAESKIIDILSDIKDEVTDVSTCVNTLVHKQQGEEDEGVIKWLTPADDASQQQDFIRRRQPGTGQWLLDSTEFQKWVKSSSQCLFCPGIPGSGKTMIAAIVVDHLYSRFADETNVGIAYIFCNFRRHHDQEIDDLFAVLLKQLVQKRSSVPSCIKELYSDCRKKRIRPSTDQLSAALQTVIALFTQTFIIIDALDECQTSDGCRKTIIEEILGLQKHCGTNIFATSRFVPEIGDSFASQPTLEIRPTDEDVRTYLEGRMSDLPAFVRRDPVLQREIKDGIVKAVDGMFLLAHLYMGSLDDKLTRKAIENALCQFQKQNPGPDEERKMKVLSQAYEDAMDRIKAQKEGIRKLAEQTLLWITCAKRPLTISELRQALAVEMKTEKLDNKNLSEAEDMVSSCAGLVTVDEQSNIIRLVHYTMQEYFAQNHGRLFQKAEENIVATCVTYLSFATFGCGPCPSTSVLKHRIEQNPLYDYAARNWGHHARASCSKPRKLILEFLCDEARLMAANQVMLSSKVPGGGSDYEKMTAPHVAALFGLSDLIIAIGDRYGIDAKHFDGQTPLSLASEKGHEAVVRVILTQTGIDVNTRGFRYLWTPLSLAARNGHYGVCKHLLEHDAVEPDPKDSGGRTPLSWAAGNGHIAVVRLLLAHKRVAPDSKATWFYKGRTPIMWAAANGHMAVVKLLLETDRVEYDSNDDDGRTLLSLMAQQGETVMVRQILAREGVNHNWRDQNGRTPLSWAAQHGHMPIIEDLMARDSASPDSRDNNSRTPLSWAAQYGHKEVCEMLLGHSSTDASLKDINGHTPLSWAAKNGHHEIVELLLRATESITEEAIEDSGPSLLSLTKANRKKEVIDIPAKYSDLHQPSSLAPNVPDHDEQPPMLRGHYSLRDFDITVKIGIGSLSRVFMAQSKQNSKFYAIKILNKAQIVGMNKVQHTIDERRMLSHVKHPFLVRTWGSFQDCKNLYIVMDVVREGNLKTLQGAEPFSDLFAKHFAAQITLAVSYLHFNNIIHRDLRPEHVLVTRNFTVKVIVISLSKYVTDTASTLCTTFEFTAPEMFTDSRFDESADWKRPQNLELRSCPEDRRLFEELDGEDEYKDLFEGF